MPDKNVQLPDGRVVAFPDSMSDTDISSVIKKQLQPQSQGKRSVTVMAPGGVPSVIELPNEMADRIEGIQNTSMDKNAKAAAAGIGAMLVPELLPAMEGGGMLGFLGRVLAKAGITGLAAGAGNATGQAATGESPFSKEHLEESAKVAGWTGALSLPFQILGESPQTSVGRGTVNKSMGVTSRDLTYANPARALSREEIADISNGDWNAYQEALRSGKTPTEAAQAAGGRFAAVSQRINELTPRLGKLLNESPAKIPVANVIDKPLEEAATDIIRNPAMGDTEKMSAIAKLGELQKSMKEGLGSEATPAQLQVLKQKIGDRINWGGTSAVTDDVKGAFRTLYGTLKEAIHRSVPGSADIDNRLTDLLGAMNVLEGSAKGTEGGKLPFTVLGMTSSGVGHVLPAAAKSMAVIPSGASIAAQLQSKGVPIPQPNAPALPFHPGAGLPKPETQP